MTMNEAAEFLKKNHIDNLIYSIGAPKIVECYVIQEKKNHEWVTYYWEKGVKNFEKTHKNEEIAVQEFLQDVMKLANRLKR